VKEAPAAVKPATSHPAKDFRDEILKFSSFIYVANEKITHAIRDGVSSCVSNNFKTSLSELSKAIDMHPSLPTGYYLRGIVKLQLRNYESSVGDLTDAVRLQMQEPKALYYRGVARYYLKDHNQSILDLTSFSKAVPDFAESYYYIGLCYRDMKNLDEASFFFSKTIEINSHHESAYFERAMVRNKKGDNAGCCEDLKKALDNGHLESFHYIKELCEKK
jgi:tetratricopeptide (TPR) repeat protein